MVEGVIPNQIVKAASVEWIGEQAINLVYRVPWTGVVAELQRLRIHIMNPCG